MPVAYGGAGGQLAGVRMHSLPLSLRLAPMTQVVLWIGGGAGFSSVPPPHDASRNADAAQTAACSADFRRNRSNMVSPPNVVRRSARRTTVPRASERRSYGGLTRSA